MLIVVEGNVAACQSEEAELGSPHWGGCNHFKDKAGLASWACSL